MISQIESIVPNAEDGRRWTLIERKAQRVNGGRAFAIFREHGIEPILIKGIAAQNYYPEIHARRSVDIDLAVDPADFKNALELYPYLKGSGLGVDIHRGLRHLDTVGWDDLFAHSIIVEGEDEPLRFLRPEDHLRVLCVHWLTDGGAYKERLWDIYYAIDNRPKDFDWDRCLNVVSRIRRRWILAVIGITHRFLQLDISELPYRNEIRQVPAWMIKTIEKEWKSSVRLAPMDIYLTDPLKLLTQIRKRLPPNPIQSTIESEGDIDARTRIHYQCARVFRRLGPSIRSLAGTITAKNRS